MSRRATQDDVATLAGDLSAIERKVEADWGTLKTLAAEVRKLRGELDSERTTIRFLAGQLADAEERAEVHEQALRALGLSTCQVCERWLPRRQSADVLVWQAEPTCSGCVPLLLVQQAGEALRGWVADWLRAHHTHSFALIAECIAKDPDLTSWVMERSGT